MAADKWTTDPRFPEKRGICDFCGLRDDLKLSYDLRMYICKNASACILRWRKKVGKGE